MYDSRMGAWMVHSHVRLTRAITEARNWPVLLVPDEALIHSRRVHRPGVDVRESVRRREFHRIKDATVVPDFDTGVGPPVETVTSVAAVVERGSLFQIG